ncbi:MAG: hypothetical protein ABSG01_11690 [Anaerolineales bacterium]
MRVRQISLYAGVFALILADMACTMNIGGPSYPNRSIPVSTEALGDLTSALGTAFANAAVSGQVTLNLTESQITSYLAYKLQAQSQPFITNPQVYLQDGKLQVYGTATQGYFQATVSLIFSAGVDEHGNLKIQLTSANYNYNPGSLYRCTWSGRHRFPDTKRHNSRWVNEYSWSNKIAVGLYQ